MSLDLPTRLDLLAIARTYIRTRAAKIDPAQVDIIGSDVNLFVGSNMVVANEVMNQLAAAVAKLLVDGASGEDLDRLAWDRFQMVRKPAAPGLVTLSFSRLSVLAGAGAVPINTRVQTDTAIDFVTTTQATFGASTLISQCAARSVQAGQLNRAAPGAIVRIPEIGALWDKTLRVTNPDASAFSADRESDEDFRSRIKSAWNTSRRGTLLAIEQGALATAGVASASAVEALTGGTQPARVVQVFIADQDGMGGSNITIDLSEYRAAGIQAIPVYSVTQYVDIQLRLTFLAGRQTDILTEEIRTAILGTVNQCPVNGILYRAALLETLKSFADDGLVYDNGSLLDPTGDLVPDLGKTIRTTIDRITVA